MPTTERVVAIAAAKHHTVVADASGAVFSCGLGVGGRLGILDPSSGEEHRALVVPCRVPRFGASGHRGGGERRAICLAAGLDHTIVLTESGDLYSWGASTAPLGYETAGQHQLKKANANSEEVEAAIQQLEADALELVR